MRTFEFRLAWPYILFFLITWLSVGAVSRDMTAAAPQISLRQVASGFSSPVGAAATGLPGDGRLFIVEQGGKIRILDKNGTIRSTPFLDLQTKILTGSERGLLGLAFDPAYGQNGYFYVNYTRPGDGATVVSRFQVSSNPDVADAGSETPLLRVAQDFPNHNGGDLRFGPDGYLYIPLGDGGSGNDPNNRAQSINTLLGSILRIDVDPNGGLPPDCGLIGRYSIPNDNPFVGQPGACDEIWAYGVRNPWRSSFDRETGDFYFGDVGQGTREEVNFQLAGSKGGENYGWRCREGTVATPGLPTPCDPGSDYIPPFFDYPRDKGRSVTGGFVYRGRSFPHLQGYYIFGDFVFGRWWHASKPGPGWAVVDMGQTGTNISSFGEDTAGELYLLDYGGRVFRVIESLGFDLALTGPSFSQAGQPINYTLTVTNAGTLPAASPVVTMTLPPGASHVSGGVLSGRTITWQPGTISPGDSAQLAAVLMGEIPLKITDYGARADGLPVVLGLDPITTMIFDAPYKIYTPHLEAPP